MRMEDTHLRSLHGDMTCVSFEHLGDGPYGGTRNDMTSFPTTWRTLPWITNMMRPCALMEQGTSDVTNLDGEICDLTLDGSNALDKGGT